MDGVRCETLVEYGQILSSLSLVTSMETDQTSKLPHNALIQSLLPIQCDGQFFYFVFFLIDLPNHKVCNKRINEIEMVLKEVYNGT